MVESDAKGTKRRGGAEWEWWWWWGHCVKEKKARRDGVSCRRRGEQRKESRRKETGEGDLGNKSGIRKRETMARMGEERGGGWREEGD